MIRHQSSYSGIEWRANLRAGRSSPIADTGAAGAFQGAYARVARHIARDDARGVTNADAPAALELAAGLLPNTDL